jgi:hypothetical protein
VRILFSKSSCVATLAQKLSSGALGGVAYQVLEELPDGLRVKRVIDGKEFFFPRAFIDALLARKR